MNLGRRARATKATRTGRRLSIIPSLAAAIVLVGLMMTLPAMAQSTASSSSTTSQSTSGATFFLSYTSDGPGAKIAITGSGLLATRPITAMFDNASLVLSGSCTTDSAGTVSGCSFVVPSDSTGTHAVSVSDGTNSKVFVFTIPAITVPESTLLVTMTSVGLSLVTQLVTRRVVDLNAERRMKAEVSAFSKEKREATLAKDKAKLEKLKKKEVPMRQAQAKVSSARLKVTAITFIPLLGVYYLMASFLGGFNVVVARSPIPIPLLVGSDGTMVLFWWYLLSSFAFSSIISKALHTTP